MSSLKKILLSMLIICTLGYGSAWAYDGHAVELTDEAQALLDAAMDANNANMPSADLNNQSAEQPSAASVDCDHCAHISAHLLAIFSNNGYLCSANQSSERLELSETFVSFIVSPDFRPPRV